MRFIDALGEPHDSWPVSGEALSLPAAVDIELSARFPEYPSGHSAAGRRRSGRGRTP
nr:hypothetical protein [Pseudomonas protegens]